MVSRLGHQLIAFGAAFDYAGFDSAGSIADFVAGNLKKVVFAQCLPDRFIRRHTMLKHISGSISHCGIARTLLAVLEYLADK